jgi:hypothetical protein
MWAHRTLTGFRPVLVMEMSPCVHAEQGYSFGALVAQLRIIRAERNGLHRR